MGRLIETVGKYAARPYYMAQMGISVYCIEELCFALCQNAFLLDKGILESKLARWLDEECGLKELAKRLYALIHQNASPSVFVGALLEYAHYGSEQKRREMEELLRKNADLDVPARRKYFADYLVKNGRYEQAVAEYEKALADMLSIGSAMRSEMLHNKGVAFCRLFCFEEAAEAFLAAYEENPDNEEAAACYLTALRMSLSEEDYIAYIAERPIWHKQSLEVEKRIEKSRRDYEGSDAYQELSELLERRDTGYYEQISDKLTKMREEYREMVAQP